MAVGKICSDNLLGAVSLRESKSHTDLLTIDLLRVNLD